ncbi:MAG TPA: hypothetical protein VD761_05740 [Solirubrobacterales bacterium]|nr:hypothetical protein [Solirubrobacterales bacterium]
MIRTAYLKVAFILCAAFVVSAAPAAPAQASTIWRPYVTAHPTHLAPGDSGIINVHAEQIGATASSGPVEVGVNLPPELTATDITGEGWACDLPTLTCVYSNPLASPISRGSVFTPAVVVSVDVAPTASGAGTVSVDVSGGEAVNTAVGTAKVPFSSGPVPFGITRFDGWVLGADKQPFSQAAGHPYEATTEFLLNTTRTFKLSDPTGIPAGGGMKDVYVELPAGLVGNPNATPRCDLAVALNCPAATQIGTLSILQNGGLGSPWGLSGFPNGTNGGAPIYNMETGGTASAIFTSDVLGTPIVFKGAPRPDGDYGLTVRSLDTSQGLPVIGVRATFWGVPADSSHDDERFCIDQVICEVNAPEVAFLTNPTNCSTGPVTTRLRLTSWADPQSEHVAEFVSHDNGTPPQPLGPQNCGSVPFGPEATVKVLRTRSDSPSPLNFDLSVASDGLVNPEALADAHVKRVRVTLPVGLSVNPSSADGLGACSEAQVAIGSNASAACPDSSKIGAVEIETPLLEERLTGGIYLAEQGNNPFGSTLAIYLVASGPDFSLKLPAKVDPDPLTGRLTATFDDNPQLPFSELRVNFRGGDRASLVTPQTCGTYETLVELAPWSAADPENPTSGEVVVSASQLTLDQGPSGGPCLAGDPRQPGRPADLPSRPFDPVLGGGLINSAAGSSSAFVLRVERPDGHQELKSFKVDLPHGVTARLAGIPYCSDAALASVDAAEGTGQAEIDHPSCPAASQIGTSTIGAGAGSSPFYSQTGKAYLAGPYKGAPLSIAVVAPVVAGPFDLGSVVVRSKVTIDPDDAQVHVATDELPQIIAGIPLRIRDIRVKMDRPGFMVAPTNCKQMAITAQINASHGAVSSETQRFQVGDCGALGFKPKLSIRLKGKTKRTGHPALTAVLTQPPSGQANISRVSVTLPRAQFIDQSRIGNVCTRPQFAAGACPADSVLGTATAYTPLLDQPLQGKVYLRANGGERELPDMVAALRGQIDVDLVGYIDSVPNPKNPEIARIRNTFALVPDAPVSKFVLKLNAGRKALLENSDNLCRSPQRARVKMAGQNGKVHNFKPLVKNDCGAKKKAKGKR